MLFLKEQYFTKKEIIFSIDKKIHKCLSATITEIF